MKLVLKLFSPSGVEIDNVCLNQNSATLGRNEDNTLVLEDPNKYISGHHAQIDFRSPDYFITDTSTNGVFLNDATQAIGNGNSAKLKNGDQINIGEYSVNVTIIDEQDHASDNFSKSFPNHNIDFAEDPFLELDIDPVQDMIDDNQLIPEGWTEDGNDSDPFNIPIPDRFESTSNQDNENRLDAEHPSVLKEAFHPVKSEQKKKESVNKDIIADNWFEEIQETNSPSKELFPEDVFSEKKSSVNGPPDSKLTIQQPDEFLHQVKKPSNKDKLTKTTDLNTAIIDNFLSGAGLENSALDESLTPEDFFIIGKILKASVQGTMDVLIGRAKIKNEMRLDATMIRAGENNPIKFSVSAEEALRKLLSPQDSGYLPAEEAIEEAFDDIRAHQFCVMAGMETALFEVLKQFDPEKLEKQLREQSPISASIPIHKQAKLWRMFEFLYADIQQEATDNFYLLFGRAFAETYEQQINKLKKTKNETPF